MGFGIIWSKEIRLEGGMAASQHPMGVGGGPRMITTGAKIPVDSWAVGVGQRMITTGAKIPVALGP